jgi:hypothetical protein
VPFYDFVEKLDMSMTGKLWAPSEFCILLHARSRSRSRAQADHHAKFSGSQVSIENEMRRSRRAALTG